MIEINHLIKKFGDHVAVNDISLQVLPGKIYGFLGPNGAGKSTTMNIITGYIGATSGQVIVNGHDIFKEPEEAKKCIGYLPEIPPLYMDMTVREYLSFVAELKQLPKADREPEVEEVMAMTKIADMEHRLIKNLSKGYRQRVGLAQAVLGYPEIIILDEPTVGLDPKQIIEMRELIRSLGEKHTVILSSHILSEVSELCDQVFIISKGKLVASDSTENLSKHLNSSQTLEVLVKCDRNKAEQIVSQLPHVKKLECKDGSEEGTVSLTIGADAQADIREEVSLAFTEEKIAIYEMKLLGQSLEDIFLELTNQEGETE